MLGIPRARGKPRFSLFRRAAVVFQFQASLPPADLIQWLLSRFNPRPNAAWCARAFFTTMKTRGIHKNGGRKPAAREGAPLKHLTPWERAANREERALRLEHHWSMEEAARHCHLSRVAISHIEHDRRGMGLRTVEKVAHGYAMEPDDFLRHARRWFARRA